MTLPAERFEELVPQAFEHIMSAGTENGRLSMAACWARGVLEVNELPDEADAPWADDPSPVVLALVGASGGVPPAGTDVGEVEDVADAWFRQLDAAGANDRTRSFADAWERLLRHDNPHGHPPHLAFAVTLADEPLALEPLAERLMPYQLLGADLDPHAAYLPGRSRRVPGATTSEVHLGQPAAEMLRPALDDLAAQARKFGLPPDATIGEVMAAAGIDVHSDESVLEMAETVARVDPAAAHAYLATDGLLLTAENQDLVAPDDRQRWQQAAGAYQLVFNRLDELAELDPDAAGREADRLDATIDGAGTLLDELVDLVDDGAMLAYDRLLQQVSTHPHGAALCDNARVAAYSELTSEVDDDTFVGGTADDVRRLVAVRFADRDPEMPAAADRALAVADTLVHGDLRLAEAVGDPGRELAVWIALVAVWRAANG